MDPAALQSGLDPEMDMWTTGTSVMLTSQSMSQTSCKSSLDILIWYRQSGATLNETSAHESHVARQPGACSSFAFDPEDLSYQLRAALRCVTFGHARDPQAQAFTDAILADRYLIESCLRAV